MNERIGGGAEAIIMRTEAGVEKVRPKKSYRHPALDEHLRTSRTKIEARILEKARLAGIPVPKASLRDPHTLVMEEVAGVQIKSVLDAQPELALRIGSIIAQLHDADLIHADLTTSNMHFDATADTITLLDFGLSFHSARQEDKAVDLHLFRQSLESKHHRIAAHAWKEFLRGYRASRTADVVLERLKKVEARGRNKGGN